MTPATDMRPCTGAELARVLMAPRSVALVGASDDSNKTGGRPQQFLRRAGFTGKVYPINPKRETVQGDTAWPSLESLPEVPEHVFVLSGTDTVLATAQACVQLGVKVLTVLASGFAETGPEGAARERALQQLVAGSGTRLLGPSSLGLVNPGNGLMLTANAAFAEPDLPRGKVFVASQSGSMIGALVSRGKARGIGFAGLVSVGGEADLSVGEVCAATLDDPAIEGYVLFLESLKHGEALRRFALEAARRGKPIVAYKLGRSEAAAEMASTHTGALAGEDDVADTFLKDCGIARVGVLDALLEAFPLTQRFPLSVQASGGRPTRVGVVTTTGGGSAMSVDQLGIRGVTVQAASADTQARLRAAGIDANPGRVLDLTLAGTQYAVMKQALDILLTAPEFDLVLAVVGSSARFNPQLAVKPIIDSAGSAKPLAAMIVPEAPEAIAALTAAGVPCFRSPEACGDAIAATFARRVPTPIPPLLSAPADAAFLSEDQAYAVLDQLGLPHAPCALLPLHGDVSAPTDLHLAYPLAVKVCSAAIPHKTDVGGVVLGVTDAPGLQAALATLRSNLAAHAPNVPVDNALVQTMCKGLGEVLLGYRFDPDAGPLVMLAAGGIWAEVMRDRSLRLAPVTLDTAREMVQEVRFLQSLTGLRGRPKGDLDALAHAVVALSQLGLRPDLKVAEAEINPLMVMPEGQGVLAVDALILQA